MNSWNCPTIMREWPEIAESAESQVECSTLATIHQTHSVIALSYEDFEACRREETAFAKSGAGYPSSQGGYQAQSSYPTASPWPGYPPPHASISDSERSNHAAYSAYWSPAGVNCQQDLTRDSDITQALSRTNALGRRQNDRQGIDNPFSQGSLYTQGRGYAPSQERDYSYTNSHSSDYSAVYGSPQYAMSSRDTYRRQSKDSMLCSSCQEQARRGPDITLCRACRLKIAPILDSCDESSSSYDSAVAMVASMLVGLVAGGLIGAEYAARNIIKSLRR